MVFVNFSATLEEITGLFNNTTLSCMARAQAPHSEEPESGGGVLYLLFNRQAT